MLPLKEVYDMDETLVTAPVKKRISDRSEEENRRLELAELDARIAYHHKQSDIAAANGDISKAQMHCTIAEIHTGARPGMVRANEKHATEAKIMASLPPLPENSIPTDVPYSKLTDKQRHALSMDDTAKKLRVRIDRDGAEGKYSVEISLMHTFLRWRDDAIKEDLGWKLHGGIYKPPFKLQDASRPSLFKRLFG